MLRVKAKWFEANIAPHVPKPAEPQEGDEGSLFYFVFFCF